MYSKTFNFMFKYENVYSKMGMVKKENVRYPKTFNFKKENVQPKTFLGERGKIVIT